MNVFEMSTRALGVLARVWLGLALSACGVAPEPSAAPVDQQRAAVLPTNGVCPGLDGGSLSIPHHYCHVRIAQLAYYGVREATLCVGHQAALIEAVIGHGDRYGLRVGYQREDEPLGRLQAQHPADGHDWLLEQLLSGSGETEERSSGEAEW